MNYIDEKEVLSGRIRELERDYAELLRQNKKLSTEVQMLTDELIYKERITNELVRRINNFIINKYEYIRIKK